MKLSFKLPTGHGYQNFRHIVGKDESRPIMHGLMVNFMDKKAYCTDANVLVSYPIEFEKPNENSTHEAISIPIEIFDITKYQFVDMKALKLDIEDVEFIYDTETNIVSATIWNGGTLIYQARIIEGTPPNCKAVIPSMDSLEANAIMRLDLSKIAQIEKAVKYKKMPYLHSRIYTNRDARASVITFSNEQLQGVKALVMPWQGE